MTEREELESRRDTLQKVLLEAQAEVAARRAQVAQTLEALIHQRDELKTLLTEREAALADREDEAVQINDDWKTSRREAAAAREHVEEVRRAARRG